MSNWDWVLIGLGAYFMLSLIVALLFAPVCALNSRLEDGLERRTLFGPPVREEGEAA